MRPKDARSVKGKNMIFGDYQSFVLYGPAFAILTLLASIVAWISHREAYRHPGLNLTIQSVFLLICIVGFIEWLLGMYRTILVAQGNAVVVPSGQGGMAWLFFLLAYLGPVVFLMISISMFSWARIQVRISKDG